MNGINFKQLNVIGGYVLTFFLFSNWLMELRNVRNSFSYLIFLPLWNLLNFCGWSNLFIHRYTGWILVSLTRQIAFPMLQTLSAFLLIFSRDQPIPLTKPLINLRNLAVYEFMVCELFTYFKYCMLICFTFLYCYFFFLFCLFSFFSYTLMGHYSRLYILNK